MLKMTGLNNVPDVERKVLDKDLIEMEKESDKSVEATILQSNHKKKHDHKSCKGCDGICCSKTELKKNDDETHHDL